MSLSSSQLSSYPSHVQKILRRLQQDYGDAAMNLALQALEALLPSKQPPVLDQETQTLLKNAYDTCCQQTGTEWVHQAMFYMAIRTLAPQFSYKPAFKTWPKFLLAYPWLFESQVMNEQLHVRLLPPRQKTAKS